MFQVWRELTEKGRPANADIADAWRISVSGARKRLRGDRPGTLEDWKVWAEQLLPLPQPEPAREFLEAVIRGVPPDKPEALAARLQQKGPGESLEEGSPNHSQGQDSPVRPTAPLKATKLLDDFTSGAAAHMTFKEFSDQVSACVQNPWTFPELSGLWKDLVVVRSKV